MISSDQIAIYELVKNSLDARATRIEVHVCVTLPRSEYLSIRQRLERSALQKESLSRDTVRQMLEASVEPTAANADRDAFLELALSPSNGDYIQALDAAYIRFNWVEITDDGSGMSFEDLSGVYLTIGTTHRLDERLRSSAHTVLGEKGIGRLSAVRLGDQLRVLTSKKGDKALHELAIDWSAIKRNPHLNLDEFPAAPNIGPKKNKASDHGTAIRMSNLISEWSIEKMESLAKTDFAKLVDPFLITFSRPNVRLYFNGHSVDIPSFQTRQLTYAHARCSASFALDADGQPVLSGEVTYKAYGQSKTFCLEGLHLLSKLALKGKRPKTGEVFQPAGTLMQGLASLGAFDMEAHWFNRQKLRIDKPDGYETALQWLKHWGGGLLLYRDHYRVYPYAEPRDDWLDLDGIALAAQGYKMNRKQLVGAVRISNRGNPHLQDQTNREGLRDTEEKSALIALLRHILVVEFKSYLDAVEEAQGESPAKEFRQLEKRLEEAQKQALKQVQHLRTKVQAPEDIAAINTLLARMTDMSEAWERSKMTVRAYEVDMDKYVHLAGVGLMTEFIFHELARLSANALKLLQTYKPSNATENRQLRNLRDQLSTLERRIRVLDPLSTPGRQRKESFDLVQMLRDVAEMHEPQFARHEITVDLAGLGKTPVPIKAVRGQILQIVENFISNSVYWLKLLATTTKFEPVISFSLDRASNSFAVLDNGPGIPEDRGDEVFNAFFTTKPSDEGRGMGLYIAKKLAEGNAMEIALAEADEDRVHHGFVVSYGGASDGGS
ncbi:MAG: sensor histidine kinase [Betaproteobacteria bacterium]|nr:sensor histidine kinase [Betaproteobacteria bacterium]